MPNNYSMKYDYTNVPLNLPQVKDTSTNPIKKSDDCSVFYSDDTTLQRQKEINEIKKSHIKSQQADTLNKAVQEFSKNGSPASVSYDNTYNDKLDKFKENVDKLSEDEYKESFEKLADTSLDTYRNHKKTNNTSDLSAKNVQETELKNAHLQRRDDENKFDKTIIEKISKDALKSKNDILNDVKEEYKNQRDDEGIISDGLNKIVDKTNLGTSREKFETKIAQDEVNLNYMQNALNSGNKDEFRVKYKEVTGQDFKTENFVKLKETENRYNEALKNNSDNKEQLETEYKNALRNAYGNNISQEALDNYVTTKAVSQGVAKAGVIIGATIATGGLGTAAVIGAAGLSSGAFTAVEKGTNKDGLTKQDLKDAAIDAAKTSAYTAVGLGANKLGNVARTHVSKEALKTGINTNTSAGLGKLAGVSAEVTTDTVGGLSVANVSGDATSVTAELAQNGVADTVIPAVASVLGGRYANIKQTQKAISNGKKLKETIPKKYIELVKKERPHLSEEMTIMKAKGLMNAEKTGTQWSEGPVDDFDRTIRQEFYQTKAGDADRNANIKKIVKPTDKHVPVQKRDLSNDDIELLRSQFEEGTAYLDEDDIARICHLIDTAEPLKENCVVYRGISSRGRGNLHNNNFIENIKVGTEIKNSNWTSTAPVYDYAVDKFHPDQFDGKGYIMRINLPKGTKGLDYRGIDLFDGQQSEYLLPPNSKMVVKKVDHVNQIIECDYILPEKVTYAPDPKQGMNLKPNWEIEGEYSNYDDYMHATDKETITYPSRKISDEIKKTGMMYDTQYKTDVTQNPDGTTTEVVTSYDRKKKIDKITKTIKDASGEKIFEKTIDK